MKKKHLAIPVIAGLVSIAGATSVFAQDWDAGVAVNVPFAFTVGHKNLPEGAYMIRRDSGVATNVFEITGPSRRDVALFEGVEGASSNRTASRDELVFSKVGNRYYLAKIDGGEQGSEISLARPASEKRLIARGTTVRIDSTGASMPAGE